MTLLVLKTNHYVVQCTSSYDIVDTLKDSEDHAYFYVVFPGSFQRMWDCKNLINS